MKTRNWLFSKPLSLNPMLASVTIRRRDIIWSFCFVSYQILLANYSRQSSLFVNIAVLDMEFFIHLIHAWLKNYNVNVALIEYYSPFVLLSYYRTVV